MSHTFNYPGFFSTWHQSDKKYGVSADTDAWIRAVSRENAAQAVEDERCVPVIPCEDEPVHTPDHPFCWDDRCPCKDADGELWAEYLDKPFKDGLLTIREANRILYDKQV